MGRLKDEVFEDISDGYARTIMSGSSIYQMIMDSEDYYYAKRKHGKWTIYDRYGWQIVGRLNEREMKNYMKLLTGEMK